MLPAVLSEDLCSLRGGQDRYAMSVLWTFDPEVCIIYFRLTLTHLALLDPRCCWYVVWKNGYSLQWRATLPTSTRYDIGELSYILWTIVDILDGPLSGESLKQLNERARGGVTLEEIRHDLLLLLKIYQELRVHLVHHLLTYLTLPTVTKTEQRCFRAGKLGS